MATLQYRLSSRVSNGHAEVLCRFFSGRDFSQRAKCRIFCPVSAWNSKERHLSIPKKITPQVAELSELQRKMDSLRDYIFKQWWEDQYSAADGWLQKTIDDYFSIKHKNERETLQSALELYIKSKEMDWRTQLQYNESINTYLQFSHRNIVYLDEVATQHIERYHSFLKGNLKLSHNTSVHRLKKLRALFNFSTHKGLIEINPFVGFSIPSEVYGTPIFLTTAERNALYKFDGLSRELSIQRDIFIFQCHVGCRVSDLLSFTKDNVQDGFLQYIPHKQRKSVPTTVRVPLSSVALEIIERYADRKRESLLPFISDVKYNVAIHELMKRAGMNRQVIVLDKHSMQQLTRPLYEVTTSHTARKTFIECMFRETKSERITSAFTGHAIGSRAFARYSDVDDDMKREILNRIDLED